ncbi:amidohydrolase [Desulfosporosinus metallidurans]|uniref:Putative amino acid amidohydrolase n=1 Tax=Desulfosporosinus metallidurans TaxID=1888891 RepID=A0A1Q8QKU7_9FIRM|nr:amidohydrolase [Desulfosporosinus metallidurans]OLN27878.1 putative amino acid amidohydrolase [Desulfosporosinus metallidurans]
MCTNHKPEETIQAHFPEALQWRRDLHKCPQPSWLEFFATGYVAEKLEEWGYQVKLGREIIAEDKQLLLPDAAILQREYDRALQAGVKEKFIAPAQGGFTGVVGILKGDRPGPTVGFRFDIDSNEVVESNADSHRPAREGFASQNPGYAHMCGHDAHTAIGLLLARHFAENKAKLNGTVKFIFQPNEENLSGAPAMIAKGLLDDLDYLFGGHVGITARKTGQIAFDIYSFLALSRFEVTYTGRPTHAGISPHEGKNALLGACAAVTNLYAIARHGDGASRINVGTLEAGTTWNVIPERAYFRLETRGVSNQVNSYMVRKVTEILHGAAQMYDLNLEVKPAATALSCRNSPDLIKLGLKVAENLPSVQEAIPEIPFNGSEDVTLMMERVQNHGGKALYVLFGTPIFGGHHSSTFDVDEEVIRNGAEFLVGIHAAVTEE